MNIDISDLGTVEQEIVLEGVRRLREGQKQYGPWKLDRYDNHYEAMCELIDAVHYRIAETLKRRAQAYLCFDHAHMSVQPGSLVPRCDDSRCVYGRPS